MPEWIESFGGGGGDASGGGGGDIADADTVGVGVRDIRLSKNTEAAQTTVACFYRKIPIGFFAKLPENVRRQIQMFFSFALDK